MSFFGFAQPNSLEDEKRKFLETGAKEGDVPVYTWGEDSYDGLGDALQEGGDELNDETFGGSEPVGKDFNFGGHALPSEGLPAHHEQPRSRYASPAKHEQHEQHGGQPPSASSRPAGTLESLWDNRSPFSLLPKSNGGGGVRASQSMPYNVATAERLTPAPSASKFSPFGPEAGGDALPAAHQQPMTLSLGANQTHGVRTLEEIEAEMREAFAAQRLQNQSPTQQQLYAQGHIRSTSAQRQHLPPQYVQGGTPPPRMHPHAQSPRFQQQQQHQQIHLLQQQQQQMQLLELQELRERQHQQQLLELQEQLRAEELERQRQQQQQQQQHLRQQQALRDAQLLQHHRQQSSGTPIGEMPYRRQAHRAATPSRIHQPQPQLDAPFQQSMQFLPREIQMQQKLLAEMAQAEFLHSLQNSPVGTPNENREVQDMLRAEAVRKIMEAERMEDRRRRKLEKIRYMSRYNDLMTQSDKDFITRIQVSQLVSQDPYSEDFYAQVYGAIQRSRLGLSHDGPEALLRFSSGGGVGLGLHQIKGGRRPSAMQRMEQQVERIVNNARMREKEKTSLNNLQGALGKTAGRSYKAAPRQLLQVDGSSTSPTISPAHAHISKVDVGLEREGAAKEAAKFGKEALGSTNGQALVVKDPLTHKEALMILERVFDITVELDLHKAQPEEPEAAFEWETGHQELIDRLWDGLRVMVPLETSNPHPFISLLAPTKGKKLLPRVMRYLDTSRNLTIVTLMVACFSQLDVVRNAPLLDHLNETLARKEALAQSHEFDNLQMHYVIPVCAKCSVRIVSGLLGLLLERNEITAIAQTSAGITMLTIFLSRVETVRHDTSVLEDEKPTHEELVQWQSIFDHLFQLLTPHFLYLFPSVRQAVTNSIPLGNVPDADHADQPTWQFLAAVGTQSSVEQQQVLVTSLRERVLENVASVSKGWVVDDEQRRMRLANVNLFLNALGLDSSQIAL